jgi:hypothetical protein
VRTDVGEWRPPPPNVQRAAPVPPDEATRADGVLQAKALKEAAKDGVPFCEKCEAARKAAREAERKSAELQRSAAAGVAAEPPLPANVATAHVQAAALRSAAQSGAAFCEKCEAAKEAARRAQETAAESMRRRTEPEGAAVPSAVPSAVTERQAAQAQAATLRTAAENGTALCEKCEAAKRALQTGRGNGT